jgi:CMP-N,N'-diacetyllegionaminic acid synthase
MINGLRVLAIVTARAGSKGLPGKNYRLLHGKPLVSYALDAGLHSQYVDDVILTSDCPVCIEIANKADVMVPFIRPDYLSADTVPSADVIEHAIVNLKKKDSEYDLFVLLEPTSPLRDSSDVDSALEAMMESKFQAIVSVCEAEDQHPAFMFRLGKSGDLVTWSSNKFKALRRQDLSPAYFLEGSVYISFVNVFIERRTFCHGNTGAYVVPKWKSLEIDDLADFICVEAIMSAKDSFPNLAITKN